MAISYIASAGAHTSACVFDGDPDSGDNDVTVSMPASVLEDDVTIGVGGFFSSGSYYSASRASIDDHSSGWTDVVDGYGAGDIEGGCNCAMSYKVQSATVDTEMVGDGGQASNGQASYCLAVYRGVDTTTPLDATTTYAEDTDPSNLPNPAAITTVTNNAWVILAGFVGYNDDTPSSPANGSYNERIETTEADGSPWRDTSATIWDFEQVTADPVTPNDYTAYPGDNAATGGLGIATMALRPASAGGGTYPVNPFGHPLHGPLAGPI